MGRNPDFRTVDRDLFRSLMRNVASSVAVITTTHQGHRHGMTATAVCSVSADPPTVLIVLNRSSQSHSLVRASKRFVINVLSTEQDAISDLFSTQKANKFDGVEFKEGREGCPIVADAAAHLECVTIDEVDSGTHTIFVGSVIGGDVSPRPPLLYHEGEYKTVSPRSSSFDVARMFLDRWSPRAFSDAVIEESELHSFFEAARWAPSSMNSQPWRFIYVRRGCVGWFEFLGCLSNTNRMWAANAAALIAFVSKKMMVFGDDEILSPTHSFDTGAAWMSFALQASLSGWHTHGMAGFDPDKLAAVLYVPKDYVIDAVAAVGRIGDSTDLPESLRGRETPSEREPLEKLVFSGRFGGVTRG